MIKIRAAFVPLFVLAATVGMAACETAIALPPLPPPPSMKPVPPAYTILRDETVWSRLGEEHRVVVSTSDAPATKDDDLRVILEHIHDARGKPGMSTVVWFRNPRQPYPYASPPPWSVEIMHAFAVARRILGGPAVHIERGVFN